MPRALLARHSGKITALVVLAVIGLVAAAVLHELGLTPGVLLGKFNALAQWAAGKNPAFYVGALAVLPYGFVPVSFLYLAAGKLYGTVAGTLLSLAGLALNLPIGYFVGKFWLRAPLTRMLEKRGHKLPEVPDGEFAKLVILMRVIPGPPLIIQNYLLAMAGTPFTKYYFISLPLTLLFAAGFLMMGDAWKQGNMKLVVAGVGFVVGMGMLAHIVKTMHHAKKGKGP